jgi:microcystin-dependent protein
MTVDLTAYLGEIRMFCGGFAPVGWVSCEGQLLDVREHRRLFALLGTTYGGDGSDTFAVPDLRGRVALHVGTSSLSSTRYALGSRGGVEEVRLNSEQLPRHAHHVFAHRGSGNSHSPSRALHAAASAAGAENGVIHRGHELYSSAAPSGRLHLHAVRPSGGSQPHDNMMPFSTLGFILSTHGRDPS